MLKDNQVHVWQLSGRTGESRTGSQSTRGLDRPLGALWVGVWAIWKEEVKECHDQNHIPQNRIIEQGWTLGDIVRGQTNSSLHYGGNGRNARSSYLLEILWNWSQYNLLIDLMCGIWKRGSKDNSKAMVWVPYLFLKWWKRREEMVWEDDLELNFGNVLSVWLYYSYRWKGWVGSGSEERFGLRYTLGVVNAR